MGGPILWGPSNIASNLEGAIINSDNSINKYDGVQNYILNSHAELNTTGWATYADAAQATPVNGTGGSPTVTWTQTTTSPLDGSGSFVFTKDAVNRQGEGASYDFTIDSASQTKVMTITFDYIIGSGSFTAGSRTTDSDIEVYIYDVTNSVLIQPSTYKLYSNSSTIPTQFIANFQASYNSTSYRLIFHCATTSASAYTVKFDNVTVSPTQYTYGTPITYLGNLGTITVTAVTSNPTKGTIGTDRITGSRIGNRVLLDYQYQQTAAGSSAAGSGDYIFALPPGMSFDSSIITPYSGAIHSTNTGLALAFVGTATMTQGTRTSVGACYAYSATSFRVWFTAAAADGSSLVNYVISSSQSGFTEAATIGYAFNINAAIQGYSSAVQTSDQTSQQVIAFFGQNSAGTTVGTSDTLIPFTQTNATTDAWNTNTYTVGVAGYYQLQCSLIGSAAGSGIIINLYKNGSALVRLAQSNATNYLSQGSITIFCNAGDTLKIYAQSAASVSLITNSTFNYLSISRVSGPASIAATDTVAAFYYASANTTGTSSAPFNFDTRVFDYTGSVTVGSAWKFTAPVAGLYSMAIYTNGAGAPDYIRLYKNGVFNNTLGYGPVNAISTLPCSIKLNAGDYIDFRGATSLIANGGSLAANTTSWCTITKTGNS